MPTYDYRCTEHGLFEMIQTVADREWAHCPHCTLCCHSVITTAPTLDIEAMANIGMPSAFEVSGDRMTKRHVQAGQNYTHPAKAQKYR